MRAAFSIALCSSLLLASSARANESPTTENRNSWDTDFGRVNMQFQPDGTVTGDYPKYSGTFKGTSSKDGTINAIWVQPSGKRTCETMQEGSYHWGHVSWKVIQGNSLRGGWAYCDDPMGSGGAWNGDKPSVGKTFATFFGTLIRVAGRVAASQVGGGIGGSVAGMAIGQATGAAASAAENGGSQAPSASAAEPAYPSPHRR